jgi:hypothetical protein
MSHQAIRVPSQRPRIPLLHIPLAALPLLQALKVNLNDHMPLALRTFVLGTVRESTEEEELERGRVGDGGEEAGAEFDAEVEFEPTRGREFREKGKTRFLSPGREARRKREREKRTKSSPYQTST